MVSHLRSDSASQLPPSISRADAGILEFREAVIPASMVASVQS